MFDIDAGKIESETLKTAAIILQRTAHHLGCSPEQVPREVARLKREIIRLNVCIAQLLRTVVGQPNYPTVVYKEVE